MLWNVGGAGVTPGVNLAEVLFFVLRHAETAGNQKKTYRGWSNAADAQLNQQGRRDALEAGRYLTGIGATVELIVADTLDRVIETAELVAQSFSSARIEKVRALHPLDVGDWTGEKKEMHPVEPFLRETAKRIPNGESLDLFNARQQQIFKSIFDLVEDFPGGRLLVVVHGSNVAYLHNHVFNLDVKKIGYEGLVDPGGIIAATPRGLVPLTKVREKKEESAPVVDEENELGKIQNFRRHPLGQKFYVPGVDVLVGGSLVNLRPEPYEPQVLQLPAPVAQLYYAGNQELDARVVSYPYAG